MDSIGETGPKGDGPVHLSILLKVLAFTHKETPPRFLRDKNASEDKQTLDDYSSHAFRRFPFVRNPENDKASTEMEDEEKINFTEANELAKRVLESAGRKVEHHIYRVRLTKGDNSFIWCYRRWIKGSANCTWPEVEIRAINKGLAKQEALQKLALDGWVLVNNEASVLEVERVYDTRWDCMVVPEGVRQAS